MKSDNSDVTQLTLPMVYNTMKLHWNKQMIRKDTHTQLTEGGTFEIDLAN